MYQNNFKFQLVYEANFDYFCKLHITSFQKELKNEQDWQVKIR